MAVGSFVNKNIDPASGSVFWSLEGENVQFTWFDVPANTSFSTHEHDSEQVTYVLEGELFFKIRNSIYKLSKGDCILIPGNVEHRVWTEQVPAKAIDAWSPINKNYGCKDL
jgi:quercetin dioxygenase-like cupin family protein